MKWKYFFTMFFFRLNKINRLFFHWQKWTMRAQKNKQTNNRTSTSLLTAIKTKQKSNGDRDWELKRVCVCDVARQEVWRWMHKKNMCKIFWYCYSELQTTACISIECANVVVYVCACVNNSSFFVRSFQTKIVCFCGFFYFFFFNL